VSLREEDLQIEVWRKPPNFGGQTVGVTDCSVRITHLPTGLEVTCGEERSQLMNKARALEWLEALVKERFPDA
jgi:protein subunit release factor A